MTPADPPSAASPCAAARSVTTVPEIWALTSYRAGETAQILALASALADALGSSWRRVDIDYQPWAAAAGFLRLTTAIGADGAPVEPWPTVLISAGLRNEPICRWVKQRSGGRTRIVFLGRTWAAASRFDLVVTTPQYRLRPAANIVENPLTLHRIGAAALLEAGEKFADRFPQGRSLTGVLLGGNSGPYRFDRAYARRLARELDDFARAGDTRLLISSSSRTPPEFFTEFSAQLSDGHEIYDWRSSEPNPYLGILAGAEQLIVSADSIAMISEAVATGKRVLVSEPSFAASPGAWLYDSATSWGHRRWTRDVSLVHDALLELNLVEWFGARSADQAKNHSAVTTATDPDRAVISCLDSTVQVIRQRLL